MTAPTALCPAGTKLPVPQIVLRADQRIVRGPLRVTADGIQYTDPRPSDRDEEGILWPRVTGPETGRPLYAEINPLRQRAAMETSRRLLCQVGLGPATVTPDGVLWIVPRPKDTSRDPHGPEWPEGWTTEPPVCLAHAPTAARWCPRLRERGYAAGFFSQAPLVAVEGTLYRPSGTGRIDKTSRAVFELDQPDDAAAVQPVDARFLLAEHLVRDLSGLTAVDLRDPELYRSAVPCNAPGGAVP